MTEDNPKAEPHLSIIFLPEIQKIPRHDVIKGLAKILNQKQECLLYMVGGDHLKNTGQWSDFAKEDLDSLPSVPDAADGCAAKDGVPCSTEAVSKASVTERVLALCRSAGIFSARATLLTVKEQQQALLLCLARKNKEIHGEFSAVASDLQDAWNALCTRTFERSQEQQDADENCTPSIDPLERDTDQLLSSYCSFIKSSNNIDQFVLYSGLSKALLQGKQALVDAFHNTVLVVEGPVARAEWLLLALLLRSQGCTGYTVALEELPGPTAADEDRGANFDLNISGINQDLVVPTAAAASPAVPPEASDSSTVIAVCGKQLQLYLSVVEDPHNVTQSVLESKCLNCFEETTSQSEDSFNWKTPLARQSRHADELGTPKSGLGEAVNGNTSSKDGNSSPSSKSWKTPKQQHLAVRRSPRTAKKIKGQACCQYVQQVMLSQVRLLINTRDELALAINCSLPGTELAQDAFSDIKAEAQARGMPMYQTILSVIMKLRLGGQGYQLDASSPILIHVKPLTVFVDHITKLTTILEDEPSASVASARILASIKRYLIQQCSGLTSTNCALKVSTVEAVHASLLLKLNKCWQDHQNSTQVAKGTAKRSGVQLVPALKMLQRLCDRGAGECGVSGESVVTLVDEGTTPSNRGVALSQGFNSPHTPLRIPSVLTLFRTPPPSGDCADDDNLNQSLRVRLMKGKRQTPIRTKRYQSCMSWAPENLSPVACTPPSVEDGPVLGPTLVAAGGGGCKRSSEQWQEVLASLPDHQDAQDKSLQSTDLNSRNNATTDNKTAGATGIKKRSSKRSLLSDISSLATEANLAKKKTKNENKPEAKSKTAGMKNSKVKPQSSNQRSIISYFKTS